MRQSREPTNWYSAISYRDAWLCLKTWLTLWWVHSLQKRDISARKVSKEVAYEKSTRPTCPSYVAFCYCCDTSVTHFGGEVQDTDRPLAKVWRFLKTKHMAKVMRISLTAVTVNQVRNSQLKLSWTASNCCALLFTVKAETARLAPRE